MTNARRFFGVQQAAGSDPFFANVVLLMHMDDAGLTDVTGKTTSLRNTVAQSGTAKFGTSASFPFGSSPAITVPMGVSGDFGAGDFTIEAWVKDPPSSGYLWGQAVAGQTANEAQMLLGFGGTTRGLVFVFFIGGTQHSFQSATGLPGDGEFHHVAWCRNGDEFSIFKDGVKDANTLTVSGSLNSWSASETAFSLQTCIGGFSDSSGTYTAANFGGSTYVDELRVTKGVCRYTADFAPPPAAFPNS